MSGRSLLVTQKQVKTILKGAAEAGVHVEIVIKDGAVRFVPCIAPTERLQLDTDPGGYF